MEVPVFPTSFSSLSTSPLSELFINLIIMTARGLLYKDKSIKSHTLNECESKLVYSRSNAVTEINLHANDELLCLLLCIVMTQDNNWRASDQPGVRPGQCAEHMVECDQYG